MSRGGCATIEIRNSKKMVKGLKDGNATREDYLEGARGILANIQRIIKT